MTEDDIEATRLSSRRADAVEDHTRLSSRKADAVDDHTRLSSRKDPGPSDATSVSVSRAHPRAPKPSSVLPPPPASVGAVPVSVHGSFGGAPTSYDARENKRVRSVSIARGAAPAATGASVASPEVRAAREAKRRRKRLYGWGIGMAAVVVVAAGIAALAWV